MISKSHAHKLLETKLGVIVPGHEIVGRVIEVGSEVKRHKVGDAVAIGCVVDSCQHCDQCGKGEEQLCRENATQTY